MFALQNISKSYPNRTVLEDVSLAINAHEVVALIGANGAGKTTLLQILTGVVKSDTGTVQVQGAVGYVPQQMPLGKTIGKSFAAGVESWRIDQALAQVNLSAKPIDTPVSKLSGGQKTRLAFAVVLSANPEPELLLLDEPTNNLDAAGLTWLAGFVRTFDGAVLLVSHDREFINDVAIKVVELKDGQLRQYGGNYDFYKEQRAIEEASELARYQKNVDERRRLEKYRLQKLNSMTSVTNRRYDPIKDNKPKIAFNSAKSSMQKSFGKQLKAVDSRLDQLEEVARPEFVKSYKVTLAGEVTADKLILRLQEVSKSFDKPVLHDIDLEIRGCERIHLVGPNGTGKTTLLTIAAGRAKPDHGFVQVGTNVSVGYFSQDADGLDHQLTGLINLQATEAAMTNIFREARSLGLTKQDLDKPVSDLSRGQQAKLGFAKLLLAQHQLLILDEPTNHLDLPTRENIEAALQDYHGAVLFASHDKYFANSIKPTTTISLNTDKDSAFTTITKG